MNNNFEIKLYVWQIIIQNYFEIVAVTITKIFILCKPVSMKHSHRFPTISLDRYWHLEQIGIRKELTSNQWPKRLSGVYLPSLKSAIVPQLVLPIPEWRQSGLVFPTKVQEYKSSPPLGKRAKESLSPQCLLPLFS